MTMAALEVLQNKMESQLKGMCLKLGWEASWSKNTALNCNAYGVHSGSAVISPLSLQAPLAEPRGHMGRIPWLSRGHSAGLERQSSLHLEDNTTHPSPPLDGEPPACLALPGSCSSVTLRRKNPRLKRKVPRLLHPAVPYTDQGAPGLDQSRK